MSSVDQCSSPSFQPYGFLLQGPRRASQHHNSCGSTPDYHPVDALSGNQTPPSTGSDGLFLTGVLASTEHGKFLGDTLEFVVPPTITPVERETPSNARCLFLGHLRFETTTAEVRWLIKRCCGVVPLAAEIRGTGCCVVYLANEADESAVRSLNRRVLFDHNGVWFARTHRETEALIDYVEKVLPRLGGRRRSLRLPRDTLVVEEPRSKKLSRRPSAAPSHAASPKEPRTFASSPPSPYSLGSPAMSGFHVAPPEYVLGESVYQPQGLAHPPPYGASWDSHH